MERSERLCRLRRTSSIKGQRQEQDEFEERKQVFMAGASERAGGAVVVELDGQARARHGGPPQEPGVRGCGFYLAHNGMPLKGWKREFDRIFK